MTTYFIVPVYNVEKYLQRCIDSIFSQTDQDFVAIFINDGSTDNSLEILNNAKKIHKNIIIVNKENGGLSSARNAGLRAIQNINDCYLCFVDSDDYVALDYIEKSKAAMIKYNADIVCSLYKGLDENGNFFTNIFLEGEDEILTRSKSLELLLSGKIKCHAPTKLYKGSLWKDTYFDETISFLEDQFLTPCIFNKAQTIVKIYHYSYFYQHHIGSLCQSKMTPNKIIDSLNSYIFLHSYSFEIAESDLKKIKKIALNEFYKIYLMMYPRINHNEFSENQLNKILEIEHFAKKHKIFFHYHPSTFKDFLKKTLYVFSKKTYCKLYKKYIKEF